MFAEAKLVFQHYIPVEITPGMIFLSFDSKNNPVVYQTNIYVDDKEKMDVFVQINGYPVLPYIYIEGNSNLPDTSYCIAQPHQIGWFDRDEECENLFDVTIREYNIILQDDGDVDIEIEEEIVWYDDDESVNDSYNILPKEDENGHFIPTLLEGLVTIRFKEEEEDNDDDDDDVEELCIHCNGSGEGAYDGTICSLCDGSGVIEESYNGDGEDYSE